MSAYTVYVHPSAWKEIKELRGHIRHRVKRAIDDLANNPRPSKSIKLDTPNFDREARRLRLEKWRILYAITEDQVEQAVDVLAVRMRPPYDYEDLDELLHKSSRGNTQTEVRQQKWRDFNGLATFYFA